MPGGRPKRPAAGAAGSGAEVTSPQASDDESSEEEAERPREEPRGAATVARSKLTPDEVEDNLNFKILTQWKQLPTGLRISVSGKYWTNLPALHDKRLTGKIVAWHRRKNRFVAGADANRAQSGRRRLRVGERCIRLRLGRVAVEGVSAN